MGQFTVESEYFEAKAAITCGQMFRFRPCGENFLVLSQKHAAKVMNFSGKYVIITEDEGYFRRFFDLDRDYGAIVSALGADDFLAESVRYGRGIRIFNQDPFETVVTFLISQNNNIPRIQGIVERLCRELGEPFRFDGERHFAFPSAEVMAERDESFYRAIGAGYRAKFLAETARRVAGGGTDLEGLRAEPDEVLREALLSLPGVGDKVADCIMLFAYRRTRAFPVDTWLARVYRESGGALTDRRKISAYYTARYGDLSGYAQQYLFYARRAHAAE